MINVLIAVGKALLFASPFIVMAVAFCLFIRECDRFISEGDDD